MTGCCLPVRELAGRIALPAYILLVYIKFLSYK